MSRLARVLAVAAACFTAAALLFTGQVWVDFAYAGRPLSWGKALLVALADWEPWVVLTPLVVLLARRFPFARRRVALPLLVHLPAAAAVGGVKLAIESALTLAILGYGRTPFSFLKIHLTALTYVLVVAVVHVARRYREARERELVASRLETELARAQVEALKMQLHPHFLFNTLNTISGLMREDVEAADLTLSKLAELLRLTLETADLQEIPLGRELQFIDAYLTIQRARYGERLRVRLDVSQEASRALVPTLLLQPLVENAVRHGIAERPGPGSLVLEARVEAGRLQIAIGNDGPPLSSPAREGFGLRNLRSRLQQLHGAGATFSLSPRPEGGAVARLDLPAREQPAP